MAKVETWVQDRTLIVQLNRPELRNCVDGETSELLKEAWLRLRDDEALWVAVLTGSGERAFCSGADLGALETLGPGPEASAQEVEAFIEEGEGYLGYTRQTDIDKPILAAVNGDALAGGLELACVADMRIAEAHARFAVACRRWGVPLVDGGTQRLPRIVGMGRAMDLILTGRFIGAEEAQRMGLVNEVVATGDSLERALEIAHGLCQVPQAALRADKRAAQQGYGLPLEEGLRVEARAGVPVTRDPNMWEGARAFKEKRAPQFNP